MEQLPEDMVANVLGRLPPCSLAASRCVRKDWCAIVDNRRLLRADLLPLRRLDAFFCISDHLDLTKVYFFARHCTTTRHQFAGCLDFLGLGKDNNFPNIIDHCNGLFLLWERVANPATRQCVPLPPFPPLCVGMEDFYSGRFLAYDPIVSPNHFEVFLIPLGINKISPMKSIEGSEWPPSTYTMNVYSSRKCRWEERSFVRQGEPAGTIGDIGYINASPLTEGYAVYLRGALYVHCQCDFVLRITLSNDKYQVIKSPITSQVLDDYNNSINHLGKSEKGVYLTLFWEYGCRVWLLNESGGQMEWILKSNVNLQAVLEFFPSDDDRYKQWSANYKEVVKEACVEEDEFEWDFDDGVILPETKDKAGECNEDIVFLGLHPYKEIVFLLVSSIRVVSYNLNSSKVQELGILRDRYIMKSFLYTACWMGDLHETSRWLNDAS